MSDSWIKDELVTAELGDKRLNERFAVILDAFAERPNVSIPTAAGSGAATGGHAEIEAAYRFFDNDKVTPEKILKPHYDATAKRCAAQDVVLCAQDTTELDFTRPQQQVVGAGPLDGSQRRGAFLHLNEAFSVDGTPLGAVSAKIWARDEPDPNEPQLSAAEKRKQRRALPIEEKESVRWLEGIRATQQLAAKCPDTLCVSLSDSEGDIYELFAEPRTTENFHLIVRACHDRVSLDEYGVSQGSIRDVLMQQPVLATNEISIRAREQKMVCVTQKRRKSRVGRDAMVEVRACAVTIKAPNTCKHDVRSVTINAVMVREVDPPQGEEPIEWILLTTLPISTLAEVLHVIQYYTVRWMIEIYFRTLKSGCRIEERRFETLPRMLACTAVYVIVAWRTLYVCRLGRSCPDMDCDVIFEPAEWQSVWTVTQPGKPLPKKPPPLATMIRLIASLGGYVNRATRTTPTGQTEPAPPGVETLWKGLQRTRDLAWAWNAFGPGAKQK